MFIDGLIAVLKPYEKYDLVGTAKNGREALKIIDSKDVDIAVIDISMPEMDGFDLARTIKTDHPHVKVLVLSMHNDHNHVQRMAGLGVDGYILKEKGEAELIKAFSRIEEEGSYYDPSLIQLVISRKLNEHLVPNMADTSKLTSREVDVLKLISTGMTAREIADELFIGKTTVDTHSKRLRQKLNCRNVGELIRFALDHGYSV